VFARRGFYAAGVLPGYAEQTELIPDGVVQLVYLGTVLFGGVYREATSDCPLELRGDCTYRCRPWYADPLSTWGYHLRYDSESKCAIK
jgi:hypothetical protein